MKLKILTPLLFVASLLVMAGCNREKAHVKTNMEEMMANPVSLSLDQMSCRRNPIETTNCKTYRMVVYVDSAECTPCALSKLRFWNPLIKEARDKKINIDYVFILASKQKDMEDVNLELANTDLQSSIYLDTAYVFMKHNPVIPKEKKYHTFLLDKENKIIFVGSPTENEKIKKIYKQKVLTI